MGSSHSSPRPWIRRAGLFTACVATILLALNWKPLAIAYYQREMRIGWEGLRTTGPNGSDSRSIEDQQESDEDHQEYMVRFERSRDALVRLAHFEKREFPLKHVTCPSKRYSELWKEVLKKCDGRTSYAEGKGWYEPTATIIVLATPERMPEFEALIDRFDVPAPK